MLWAMPIHRHVYTSSFKARSKSPQFKSSKPNGNNWPDMQVETHG